MGLIITLLVLTALAAIPLGVSVTYEKGKFLLKIKAAFLKFSLPLGKKKPPEAEKKPAQAEKEGPREESPTPGETSPTEMEGSIRAELPEKKEWGAEVSLPKTEVSPNELQIPEKPGLPEETILPEKAALPEEQPAPKEEEASREAEAPESETIPAHEPPDVSGETGQKRDLKAYVPFVRLAVDLLSSLRRKLRIEKLYLKLTLAGQDPCDLAVLYGKTWAAAVNAMGLLKRMFVIENPDLNIQCDFLAEKTLISARMDLTITLGRLLSLAAVFGVRALKEYFIFKKRKGGAAK